MRLLLFFAVVASASAADDFAGRVLPALSEHCSACHNPDDAKNRHNFLRAQDATDVETRRVLWRDVATQLRNRTMPPGDGKLPEADRLFIADWIENRLLTTGCTTGEYAGYVGPRRLNRREYRNTIRDLFGVDLPIADLFAADEAGGAGFDTNGSTLYLPPLMVERYMEAAQAVVDRVVVAEPLNRVFLSYQLEPRTPAPQDADKPLRPMEPGERLSAQVTVFADAPYSLRVSAVRPKEVPYTLELHVDGVKAGELAYPTDKNGGVTGRAQTVNLSRGSHTIEVVNGDVPTGVYTLTVAQQQEEPSPDQRSLHYRLLGVEAGQTPIDRRATAERMLRNLLPRAYRMPVDDAEVERFLALYDRSAQRGDPFEESVKYALKGVLLSPRFLFRIEEPPAEDGIRPLGQYETASRLSYFLWSTMPDEELLLLARKGKLQDPETLAAQVDRMIDDPRSRSFAGSFMGQWLGTNEIGGRVVPLLTELQHFYTPEVAADLREQPEIFFHYILTADRSVLDILDAPYTFLTEPLARYYQVDERIPLNSDGFHKVDWPDDRRAGVLGFASVLAMTSHYKQPSPVLRGAWVLETLLGTPVPPPPPDVPPLPDDDKAKERTMREMLAAHREATACAACHNLMDPIGLGLENFDWMGRWRDTLPDGRPVDATGSLPTGETFDGPSELREVLMSRQDDFLRHLVGKVLGYAIGRGRQDGDQCTIEGIVAALKENDYSARTLIREVVLSVPFRNLQRDAEAIELENQGKRLRTRLLGVK